MCSFMMTSHEHLGTDGCHKYFDVMAYWSVHLDEAKVCEYFLIACVKNDPNANRYLDTDV